MQGSKLHGTRLRARLWIAGVSTAAILLGCEAEPAKDQAANSNQLSTQEAKVKSSDKKEAVAQGAATPAAEIDQYSQGTSAAAPAPGPVIGINDGALYRQQGALT